MALLNREEFMKEFEHCTKTEGNIDLPDEILSGRAEFLFVVYELLMGKMTVSELNRAYIILAGLLLGKYPKIAFSVRQSDRIRLPFVALDKLPSSKGKLTEREKLLFSFCVFYSVCVEVYDENTGEIHKGITDIESREKAMWLFVDDMENHPERYAFLDAPKKPCPENSAPFGTSIDNPIQAVSVADSYSYLNSLRTPDGKPVPYKRIGSMAGGVNGIIDGYTLYLGQREMMIYIDPYAVENSAETPEGLMLARNESIDEDDEVRSLIRDAENGDGKAQFELGLKYYHGEGVRQDYSEAFKWYSLSAEQGYDGALTNLGLMYSRGHGVRQDYRKAAEYYRLAAEMGFPDALHNLGFMYSVGRGVQKDMEKAFELWHKAAEKGHPVSQFNIALDFMDAGNYSEAFRWMKESAEGGYMEAQHNLAVMYENGEGVSRDISEAVKWYRLAAENGSEDSREALQRLGVH